MMVVNYGLLEISLICVCCLESGSYTCFMRFISKEHKKHVTKENVHFSIVVLNVTILSAFNILITYVVYSINVCGN